MTPFFHPTFILAILVALSFHEAAHGWVARRLGDPTAEHAGRVTLNPLAHLDPLGTILFLVVGFGWGKPVPVNPMYFRNPKRDTALVSLAGPASNLLLAVVSFALLAVFFHPSLGSGLGLLAPSEGSVGARFLASFLGSLLFINLGLMAFNLLPVAPLDGSKIVQAFVPLRHEEAYEEFLRRGPVILLILLLAENFLGFPFLSSWINAIINGVLWLLGLVFGGM